MNDHCTIDDLLALRDGDAGASVRAHIEACELCQEASDALGQQIAALRALPARRPPRDRWPVVRERFRRERRGQWIARTGWGGLAVAAGLAVAIGLRSGDALREPDAAAVAAAPELSALVDQSRELEEALVAYGTEGRVLSGHTASVIAELEDRIAAVDVGITHLTEAGATQNQLTTLWRDRVQLLGALVNTHVTRAAYVGF